MPSVAECKKCKHIQLSPGKCNKCGYDTQKVIVSDAMYELAKKVEFGR